MEKILKSFKDLMYNTFDKNCSNGGRNPHYGCVLAIYKFLKRFNFLPRFNFTCRGEKAQFIPSSGEDVHRIKEGADKIDELMERTQTLPPTGKIGELADIDFSKLHNNIGDK